MSPTTWSGQFRFPTFHGDPEKFPHESWTGYEEALDLAYIGSGIGDSLSPEVRKAHLLYGLEGKARKERELHPEWKGLPLEELQRALRNTFNRPRWRDLTGIGNIVQKLDESCREYASRLKYAIRAFAPEAEYTLASKKEAKAAVEGEAITEKDYTQETEAYQKVTDKLLLNYFIQNLRPDLKKTVVASRPRSMSEALEIAEAHEQYVEMLGGFKHVHMTSAEPERTLNLQVEPAVTAAAKQLTEINNRPHPNFVSRANRGERGYQNGGPPRQAESRCYSCNKPGHFQRECPERDQDAKANYRCHSCDQPGHFQRDCPQREPPEPVNYRCHFCDKPGHFQRDCRAKARQQEQQGRKNYWGKEKTSGSPPPSPNRSRVPRVRPQVAEPHSGHTQKSNQWPATGKRLFRAPSSGSTDREPRKENKRVAFNVSKNGQRGGPRAPANQTIPQPFTRRRRPTERRQG